MHRIGIGRAKTTVRRCAGVALSAALAGTATAEVVVVQVDSLGDGATGAVQAGFVAGEEAAVWLTSPCNGEVIELQIQWASQFGLAGSSVEDSIKVYEGTGATFPTPGAVLLTLPSPFLTDGFLNQFLLAPGEQIARSAGDRFVVALKFANTPLPILGASVVTDTDGCQPNTNGILAIPGGWTNSCFFGLSGDFVIRAVMNCDAAVCPEDFDGSGDVAFADLLQLLAAWGPCVGCPEDLDGSGDVAFADLLQLLAAWGDCP